MFILNYLYFCSQTEDANDMNKFQDYKIYYNRLVITLTVLLISSSFLLAQKPESYTAELTDFERGKKLYQKEKYASALTLFDSFINTSGERMKEEVVEAEYLAAMSALRLFNQDAEYRMNKFVSTHPDDPHVNDAWLELANHFYQSKNYRRALKYYEQVDRLELNDELLPAYYFQFGYSHFMDGEVDLNWLILRLQFHP